MYNNETQRTFSSSTTVNQRVKESGGVHLTDNRERSVVQREAMQKQQGTAKPPVQRKAKVNVRDERSLGEQTHGAASVQLMKFAYDSSGAEASKASKKKLKEVIPILQKMVAKFGTDKSTVTLKLINKPGMSPAYSSAHLESGKSTTENVLVTLNHWYLQKASVGDIVGMLTHELGVHHMADFHMGVKTIGRDGGRSVATGSPFLAERAAETVAHTTGAGMGLAHGPHTLAPINRAVATRRQNDHVNIGKGLITQQVNSRAQVYLQTFLAAGDAIQNDRTVSVKERKQRFRDLIQSFFFDIARIVATDDGKALAMFSEAEAIAELMNYYQQQVVLHHSLHHPWLADKSLKVNATKWGLRAHLAGLIGKLLTSSHPTVQDGRGLLAGGLVTAGAMALGGLAFGPALAIGTVAGLGIWGASKALGY